MTQAPAAAVGPVALGPAAMQQTQITQRPANVNQWGREGEKMNLNQSPSSQAIFQHRGGTGLQIPNQNPA